MHLIYLSWFCNETDFVQLGTFSVESPQVQQVVIIMINLTMNRIYNYLMKAFVTVRFWQFWLKKYRKNMLWELMN